MTKVLQFWISGVNNDPCINILDKVESIITQNSNTFTELEYCRHEYLRVWMSYVFNDQKFTILNESSQQLNQYQHSWQSGVINNSKSIIFTELEDYMHESLRLWKTGFFNDQNFTILNKWSQQCSHHQDCLRKEPIKVQDSIILIELEDYRSKYLWLWLSGVFNDHKFTILNEWSQQLNQYQHSSQSGVTNNLKSIIFTELEDYMHESLQLWKSGFFNDQNFTILN